jgi:hypothetical protein
LPRCGRRGGGQRNRGQREEEGERTDVWALGGSEGKREGTLGLRERNGSAMERKERGRKKGWAGVAHAGVRRGKGLREREGEGSGPG